MFTVLSLNKQSKLCFNVPTSHCEYIQENEKIAGNNHSEINPCKTIKLQIKQRREREHGKKLWGWYANAIGHTNVRHVALFACGFEFIYVCF